MWKAAVIIILCAVLLWFFVLHPSHNPSLQEKYDSLEESYYALEEKYDRLLSSVGKAYDGYCYVSCYLDGDPDTSHDQAQENMDLMYDVLFKSFDQ